MRFVLPLLLCVAAFPVAAAPTKSNPFAGHYDLTAKFDAHVYKGAIRIGNSGAISGHVYFAYQWGGEGWLSDTSYDGRVAADGSMTVTITEHIGDYSYTDTGQAQLDAEGNLVFTGTRDWGGGVYYVWYRR